MCLSAPIGESVVLQLNEFGSLKPRSCKREGFKVDKTPKEEV